MSSTTPNPRDPNYVQQLGGKTHIRLLELHGATDFKSELEAEIHDHILPLAGPPFRYWFLAYDPQDKLIDGDEQHSEKLKNKLRSICSKKEKLPFSNILGQALRYLRPQDAKKSIHVWVQDFCANPELGAENQATLLSIIQGADATIAFLGLSPTLTDVESKSNPPRYLPRGKKVFQKVLLQKDEKTPWELGHSKDLYLMDDVADLSRLVGRDQRRRAFENFSQPYVNDWPVFCNAFVRDNPFWRHFPNVAALQASSVVMFVQGCFACPDYILKALRFEGSSVVPADISSLLELADQLPAPTSGLHDQQISVDAEDTQPSGASTQPSAEGIVQTRQASLPGLVHTLLSDGLLKWENFTPDGTKFKWSHLWENYLQTKVDRKPPNNPFANHGQMLTDIVRDAAVAQDVLTRGAATYAEFQSGKKGSDHIWSKGYRASEVEEVGIFHTDFRHSGSVAKLRICTPGDNEESSKQLGALRYTQLSLNYTPRDLRFLRPFSSLKGTQPRMEIAWALDKTESHQSPEMNDGLETRPITFEFSAKGPSYFSGTNGCIGLAPECTKRGDWVVKFEGCDAALIFRPEPERPGFGFAIGRADVSMPGEPFSRREIIEQGRTSDPTAREVDVCMG